MSDPQPIAFEAPTIEELSDLLSGYSIDSFIAQGGMGAVYLATQTSLDREVAIKILPKEFGDDPEFREAFKEEAKLMAKLNHPNLIAVYDFGSIEGMLYIIMEYAEGSTLHHLIHDEQEQFPHSYVASVAAEIAAGLSAAHDAGILHRDIKPSNILLTNNNQAKISDFGLARPHGDTESGVIYGTPGYTAPEVLKHPEAVDSQADIFSVGVILYELLAGKLPQKAYMPVTSVAQADPRFDNIIRKAIHPSPKMRYRNAKDLADDLLELEKELIKKEKALNPPKPSLNTSANKLSVSPKLDTSANKLSVSPKLNTAANKLSVSPKLDTAANKLSVTPSTETAANKLSVSPAPDSAGSPAANGPGVSASTLQKSAQKKGNKAMLINLIIIAILAVACVIAWDFVKKKQADAADQIAENKRIKELNKLKEKNAKKKKSNSGRVNSQGGNSSQSGSSGGLSNVVIPDNEDDFNLSEKAKTTHAKALKQLKSQQLNLLSGIVNIDKLPANTITQDKRFYLFINQPMTWPEADAFCGAYGGQIATCANEAEAFFLQQNANEKRIWLGAATSNESSVNQVDGGEFAFTIKHLNPLKAVSFRNSVSVLASSPLKKYPFFIQWNVDGSMPSSQDARLLRLLATSKTIRPSFPALTFNRGSTFYYVVRRPLNWKQANQLARATGGHLAVISNDTEGEYLRKFLTSVLPEDQPSWVGGRKNSSGKWVNATAESFTEFHWGEAEPKQSGDGLAITMLDSELNHVAIDKKRLLATCVIEWSKSEFEAYKGRFVLKKATTLKALQAEIELLKTFEKKYYASQQRIGVVRLAWVMKTWKNSVSKKTREQYGAKVSTLIKSLKTAKRIPSRHALDVFPAELNKIIEICHSAQTEADFVHKQQLSTIVEGYEQKLREIYNREKIKKGPELPALRQAVKDYKEDPKSILR